MSAATRNSTARCCSATAREDFDAHRASPTASRRPGRFPMTSSSPGTARPSSCSRCAARSARTRPSRRTRPPYPFPPVPDEPPIAEVARAPEARSALHPFSLPLGVDIDAWLGAAPDALGRLSRHPHTARWTPRPRRSPPALRHANVELETGAEVDAAGSGSRTAADRGRRTTARTASRSTSAAEAGGAVGRRGAARPCILLRSAVAAAGGLANRSDLVGRNFMNHNSLGDAGHRSALPQQLRLPEDASASTISISTTARAARRSAMSSCSARSTAPILKANLRLVPEVRCSTASPRTPSTCT